MEVPAKITLEFAPMRMDIGSTARTAYQVEIADKEPTSALDSAFANRTIENPLASLDVRWFTFLALSLEDPPGQFIKEVTQREAFSRSAMARSRRYSQFPAAVLRQLSFLKTPLF